MERRPPELSVLSEEHQKPYNVAEQVTLQILPVWERIFPEATDVFSAEQQALTALKPVRLCVPVDVTIANLEQQIRQLYFSRCREYLRLSVEVVTELLGDTHVLHSGNILDPQSTLRALRIASGTTLRWLSTRVSNTTPNTGAAPIRRNATRQAVTNRLETRVYRLEPNTGLTSGGARVLVFGSNFPAVARVRFGHVVVNANRHSAQCLECIAPAHEPGVVNVEVSTRGSDDQRPDAWTQDHITYTYVGYERLSMILAVHAAERRVTMPLANTASGVCRPTESLSWNHRDSNDDDRKQH
jgi:hypothetical protein